MIKSILLVLLLSFTARAEYAIEFASNQTMMEWKGISHALYKFDLKTIGLVYFKNNFGARIAYGKARITLPEKGAAIDGLKIELKKSIDIELLYRYRLHQNTSIHFGIGYYMDNMPITSTKSDFRKNDWDRGMGWSITIDQKISKRLSLQLTTRKRASVGKSNSDALGSSHNSIGVSIRYMF